MDSHHSGPMLAVLRPSLERAVPLAATRHLISLISHANDLSIGVRFVIDSPEIRERVGQFAETSVVPAVSSVDLAFDSLV